MAALLLQRQALRLHQSAGRQGSSRAVAAQRYKPFTSPRIVVARAAEPEAEEVAEGTDIQAEILELLGETITEQGIELDDETLEVIKGAEGIVSGLALEQIYEEDVMEGGDAAAASSRAAATLESLVDSNSEAAALALDAIAAEAEAEQNLAIIKDEDIEDVSVSSGKYDEEEDAIITPEQRAAIAPLKLTQKELSNLLPKEWDGVNVDWFTNKRDDKIPLPEYKLNFLWMDKNIAVSVDQVYSRGQSSPLTEYFFWPRKDAWEELRSSLDARQFISARDKVILLNRLTEVINFWQDEQVKHTLDEAKTSFPDCTFA